MTAPINTEIEISLMDGRTDKMIACLTCELPTGGKRYMNAVQGVLAAAATSAIALAVDETREGGSGGGLLGESL